jgi:hypothetical protein
MQIMKQNLFFISLLALMLIAGKGWGQPWTYNFGTGTGSHTSGPSTDFLPAPLSGTARVRIGSGAGQISLNNPGTTLGSGTELQIVAATGTSTNKAGIYTWTSPSTIAYVRFLYRTTSSGNGNLNFSLGASALGSDNQGYTGSYSNAFVSFTITYASGSINSVVRRISGSNTNIASHGFSKDADHVVEVFANNSISSSNYFRNGTTYTLDASRWDLWVDGTRVVTSGTTANMAATANLDGFAFYAESSGSNAASIYVDDIEYSNSLPLSSNYIFVWPGDFSTNSNWNTRVSPSSANTATLNANAQVTTNQTLDNLTISAGSSISINNTGSLTVSSSLTNNAGTSGLVVASGGSLIHSTAAVPGTVQRSITAVSDWNDPASADEGWHLISSPVASQNIDGSWTPAGAGNGYDFYAWSEATNTWLNQKIIGNNITAFEVGKGYIAAYEQTAIRTFTGDLNSANVTVNSLTRTEAEYVDPNDAGFNLVGNPFPSAIRWHGTGVGEVDWSLVNISGVAQVWDRTGKDYAPVNADDLIPSGNGFMVQLTSGTTGSITIPAAAKAHDAQPFYKSSSSSANAIKLVAREADNRSAKRSNIILNAQASNEFDAYLDGRYLAGYGPRFYSLKSGKKLSSYSIPEFNDDMIIPFGFTKNSGDLFVIELLEGIEGKTLYLTDLKLNIKTNLTQEGSYSFTSTEGDDPNRFLLHFGAVGVDEAIPATAVAAYVSNNILYVLNAQGKVQVDVMDISGRLVHSQSLQTTGLSSTPLSLPAGVYVVRLNNGQTTNTNKVIIQ